MTGTVENEAPMVITDLRHDALQIGFQNGSSNELTSGQEVSLKSSGAIEERSVATSVSLGIVIVGAKPNFKATVRTNFTAIINGVADGGAVAPGDLLVPTGTKNSDGIPSYEQAAAGDYSIALAIKGGATGDAIRIGILNAPVSAI